MKDTLKIWAVAVWAGFMIIPHLGWAGFYIPAPTDAGQIILDQEELESAIASEVNDVKNISNLKPGELIHSDGVETVFRVSLNVETHSRMIDSPFVCKAYFYHRSGDLDLSFCKSDEAEFASSVYLESVGPQSDGGVWVLR